MKVETKMKKILNNAELSKELKVLKLENLALACIAHSPIQLEVINKYTELKNEVLKDNPNYFNELFNKCFPNKAA